MSVLHHHPVDSGMRETMVSVSVPYHMPGNVIGHLQVKFRVGREGNRYHAEPVCTDNEKRLLALPSEFSFGFAANKVLVDRSDLADVAAAIYRRLSEQEVVGG